jgi:hypothetical protein
MDVSTLTPPAENFKYRLWLAWYIVSLSRDPKILADRAVDIWLEIAEGSGVVGDLWLWQDDDEDHIRNFTSFPEISFRAGKELSRTDWTKARRSLEEREARMKSSSPLSHLTSSSRIRIMGWFIIAGPVRHAHLRRGHCQTVNTLIWDWANSVDAIWNFTTPNCEVCGVSGWLDAWIETMLEIYSLRQLRSLPWHLTCNCLERYVDLDFFIR